ncbi:hypothetical protein Tco_0008370 [Tanacetum coccineum]
MKTSVATGTTAVERGDVRWLCKVKPDCALYGIAQSGSCLDEVFKFRLSVLDSKGNDVNDTLVEVESRPDLVVDDFQSCDRDDNASIEESKTFLVELC